MTTIIDRRGDDDASATTNRKKFLDRYKKHVRDSVRKAVDKYRIKDVQNKRNVVIPTDPLDEPVFTHDEKTGTNRRVLSGNDQYQKGDRIKKQKQGGGGGGGASDQSGDNDPFAFTLTKEEFLDVLFADMALPNYVKESMKKETSTKMVRSGYTKDGIMPRLDLKKSAETAMARRISQRGAIREKIREATTPEEIEELEKKRVPYLDDIDLRYRNYVPKQFPKKQAVMFCLMDVSGSMSQLRKELAKRFFLLLYLFLEREYDSVDIRFIRHAETAQEVDEDTFFYSRESGGTVVSSAFEVLLDIIDKEYDTSVYNIYVAQASDGDNFTSDNQKTFDIVGTQVLPLVQYMAYVETSEHAYQSAGFYGGYYPRLSVIYQPLVDQYKHFNMGRIACKEDVFPILRGLFTDE